MSVMVDVQQCFLIEGRDVHEVADDLMEHLVTLSDTEGSKVLDSAVDGDSDEGSVTIQLTVSGEDLGDGVNVAVGAMRTAIHATGGSTANWFTKDQLESLIASVGNSMKIGTLEPVA